MPLGFVGRADSSRPAALDRLEAAGRSQVAAAVEWHRRDEIHGRYWEVIAPLLPATVRRLCVNGLHDGVVREASMKVGELMLRVDATHALSGYRGRETRLIFRGVQGRPVVSKRVGQWWLYDEAHLRSQGRFSIQVLFDKSELETEASELVIELGPKRSRRPRT